jgi:hypothetical protein
MLFVVSSLLHADAQEMTRTHELSSVRLSYNELSQVVTKARGIVESANRNSQCGGKLELLDIGSDSIRLTLRDDFSPGAFVNAPPISTSVQYHYSCGGAPISRVDLGLHDVTRKIVVSGHSRDQVELLEVLLVENMGQMKSRIGGSGFRRVGGIVLWLLAWALLVVGNNAKSPWSYPTVAGALTVFLSLFILPWSEWFPGVVVYAEGTSFLVRNAPLITFIGAMLGIVGIGLSIATLVRRGHAR